MTIEAVVEEIRRETSALRNLIEKRDSEVAQFGEESRSTRAALDAANTTIDHLQARLQEEADQTGRRLEELENRLNRDRMGGRGHQLSDETRMGYANWLTHVHNRHHDPFEPSDIGEAEVEEVRAYRQAFNRYLGTGQVSNEMSVGSDPDGGYWVDPDMSGRLVSFIYETSSLRGLASEQTVTGDALEGEVDLGEASDGWVGETEVRGETNTPQIAEWRIPLREQYAQPYLTQRVIDFANRDVAAWLEGKVRRKLSRSEATASVSGDGAKRPRGFLTYEAGTPGSTVATWPFIEQVASGAAAAITPDGLINLVFALKSEYASNAVMGMRRDTERQIRELKTGDGAYIWQPDFTARSQARVLGLPVREMPDMPAVAASALPIVVADFGEAYQFVDSPIGVRVLRDNVTTKGKVKLYTTRYVGGDVINFEAIKLMVVSAS